MEENETVMKEMWLSLGTENEDAGDRVQYLTNVYYNVIIKEKNMKRRKLWK